MSIPSILRAEPAATITAEQGGGAVFFLAHFRNISNIFGTSYTKKEPVGSFSGQLLSISMSRQDRLCQRRVQLLLVMMGALLLGWFLKLSIAAEVLLLVMVGAASWIIVRRWRLDRARRAFLSRFPEAVDNFTRSIQAGIPVDRALKILGEAYDDEFGRRVLKLCREMKVGLPFREALGNFADELDDPDVDFFCEVLALNRETGSALSPMLASLSMMLRERRAIDRKLKALTSESRASARVLCLLPVFILGLQAFLNPSQLLFLVSDPAGRIVAGCALACMLAGFIIIQRMSRSLNG